MTIKSPITTFINLTPHRVSIVLASGEDLHIEAQPEPARVEQSHTFVTRSDSGDAHDGRTVEISTPVYGAIVGLPEPRVGVAYICSVFVANAAAQAGRTDVLYPDSGPDAVRERGQVISVKRLLAPTAKPEPHRDPEVQETLRDLHERLQCLGLREDFGDGEQPAGTRRDGTFLGYPSPCVWVCRIDDTYWLLYWDYGYQSWVRDPMPGAPAWPVKAA